MPQTPKICFKGKTKNEGETMIQYKRKIVSQSQETVARSPVELADMEEIKYHNIFDQIPRCGYCDIVGLTIGAFTKSYQNEFFDK